MRFPRRTYDGAFHHGMNRGYEGRPIFRAKADKVVFLELLDKVQGQTKIRILAYCVMDNHYHLVLQNESGKMSDFFKRLNGQYAIYYRKVHGGMGYVFQDRYKSMLIQNDAYLLVAIAYILSNPVNAEIIPSFLDYPWSSAALYFSGQADSVVDKGYVESLFGTREDMVRFVNETDPDGLPVVGCELGPVIGGADFVPKALELAERRSGMESVERRRIHDKYFDPPAKVFAEFEMIHQIKLLDINLKTFPGKQLRAELLVHLKERTGMSYREIARLDLFSDLEFNSLGGIYRQTRSRLSLQNRYAK